MIATDVTLPVINTCCPSMPSKCAIDSDAMMGCVTTIRIAARLYS
jgi:hypothetical protein